MFRSLLAAVIALTVAAPVLAEDHYPLKEGNRWTYSLPAGYAGSFSSPSGKPSAATNSGRLSSFVAAFAPCAAVACLFAGARARELKDPGRLSGQPQSRGVVIVRG